MNVLTSILLNNQNKSNTFFRVDKDLLHSIGVNKTLIYACIREQFCFNESTAIDSGGWLQIGIKKIQKDTGFSDKTVRNLIKDLVDEKLLACCKKDGGNNYYKIFAYRKSNGDNIAPITNTWARIFHIYGDPDKEETDAPCGKNYRTSSPTPGKNYRASNEDSAYSHEDIQRDSAPSKNLNTKYKEEESALKFSLRRSPIRSTPPKENNTPRNSKYSDEERAFVEKAMRKIQSNHPKIITPESLPRKIQCGLEAVHKLVRQYKDFAFVRDCIEWAINDSFWKDVIQSLAQLPIVKKKEDLSKFEKIAAQYLKSKKDPVAEFDTTVEKAINDIIESDDYYEGCNTDVVHGECSRFFEMLDQLSRSISPARNRFYWHKDANKFIETLKWGLKIDGDLFHYREVTNWIALVEKYIEFLQYRLQDNSITTVHPGMFNEKSALFNNFVNDLSAQWGRRILETQPDEWGQ